MKKYKVLYSSKEKMPWNFDQYEEHDCSIETNLKTGDYTVQNCESFFIIERKRNTSEFSRNIIEERFEKEFIRMLDFKYRYVICEFDVNDILSFPRNSGIPKRLWYLIKINPKFLLKKICELSTKYDVHFIFAGNRSNAIEIAHSLFKRILELNEEKTALDSRTA